MTIRKTFSPRDYETFSANGSDDETATSHTQTTSDSQKTRSAAAEAQRLASQGSWGDNYANGTPITNATPTASTADETEERYGGNRYPADPPPIYTPTDTAASSPTTARQQPESVRQPSSPFHASPSQPEANADEDETVRGAYTQSSPLLESGQPPYPCDNGKWSRDKCKLHRHRRFKKACCFTFALALCLWLMIPALCNLGNKARTRMPRPSGDPLGQAPIPSWPKPSREYRRHETSQSIHGTYQLYDLLDLETVSGSISITVNPQSGETPAVLRLSSTSGSISVRMGDSSWNSGQHPHSMTTNRTFQTSIDSTSGTVSGSVLHGNGGTTNIRTRSGSIRLTVNAVGVGKDDSTSRLLTSSASGSQNIKLHSVDTVRALVASHVVHGSGGLGIDYPSGWEGVVHAKSRGSGSVQVDGSNLEYQGGGRDVWARRGKGELKDVEVTGTGSGSVQFRC